MLVSPAKAGDHSRKVAGFPLARERPMGDLVGFGDELTRALSLLRKQETIHDRILVSRSPIKSRTSYAGKTNG